MVRLPRTNCQLNNKLEKEIKTMAKNYSIAEAVQIIAENEDKASITDLGKRYPLLTNKIARVAVLAGDEFVDFASYLPEHVSANKVNKAIKDAEDAAEVDEDVEEEETEDDEDEEVEEEEAPKKKAKKAPEKKAAKSKKKEEVEEDEDDDEEASDYDNMSNKELWALLGEVGGRKKCREEFGDTKTADMIKYFKKYYPNGVDAEQPEEAEEEASDEYTGKSAVELYKMCKTRKIKAEQKKPAKYYVELLKKADAAAAKTKKKAEEAEDEGDDWDDEEEQETPKKSKAKAEKKSSKKAEPVEEEDDDDDWEI